MSDNCWYCKEPLRHPGTRCPKCGEDNSEGMGPVREKPTPIKPTPADVLIQVARRLSGTASILQRTEYRWTNDERQQFNRLQEWSKAIFDAVDVLRRADVHGHRLCTVCAQHIVTTPLSALDSNDGACQWPGCNKPALCESGNVGNKRVCSDHFKLTNGDWAAEVAALIFHETVFWNWPEHWSPAVQDKSKARIRELIVSNCPLELGARLRRVDEGGW